MEEEKKGERVGVWFGESDLPLLDWIKASGQPMSAFIKKALWDRYAGQGSDLADTIADRVVERLCSLGLVVKEQGEATSEDEEWRQRLLDSSKDFF